MLKPTALTPPPIDQRKSVGEVRGMRSEKKYNAHRADPSQADCLLEAQVGLLESDVKTWGMVGDL